MKAKHIVSATFIIILSLILFLAFSDKARALDFNSLMSLGNTTVETIRYNVETTGKDIRVYEWQSPSGRVCTWAISSKASQMDCDWPK